MFGRLLGVEAGHWQIQPRGGDWWSSRRYVERSLVLETTFTGSTGNLVVTDLLAMGNGGHRLGADVLHLLVRRVACVAGTLEVEARTGWS